MKKTHLLAAVVSIALPVSVFAVPAPVFVKSINVGASLTAPSGIAADPATGDLYVLGFTNRALAKVTNPLGTEVVSTLVAAIPPSPLTGSWGSGRGPQGIAIVGTTLYVVGDDGTNGSLVAYNTGGTQLNSISSTGALGTEGRSCSIGPDLWGGKVLIGRAASSPILCADPFDTGSALAGNSISGTGSTAAVRGAVAVGNDVYSYASTATNNSISKFTGGTAGSWVGYTGTASWNTLTGTNGSGAFVGIGKYSDGATTWIVAINPGAPGGISFFNTTTNANDLTFQDATNLPTGGPKGLAFASIGGTDYMFVTNIDASPTPNTVRVYSLGPSSVNDWSMY
ncbi:MAG TPA: hypothetical protein PKD58_04855 [Candidatus Sumerlaeota bacterium]|nr:hypothetical protein [Candidatus Sumerlaeota bacterium]